MARGSSISNYEIGMIKALINKGESNQNILGYINHYRGDVTNHINNGRITDVKQGKIGKDIKPASLQEAEEFIKKYKTSYQSDEITNLLRVKDGYLLDEENERLEYKKSFNGFRNNEALLKSIQGMSNNSGGFIVFGIEEEVNGKNKQYKVCGIDNEQIKKFNIDNKEISNKLLQVFGENIEFSKDTRVIANKNICILNIKESINKPIIDTNGEIYYRYNAQNLHIKKIDLLKILQEREIQDIELTLYKHIKTILKNGIENSAILNIQTGDIQGKSGNFLIDESLLPKIAFIKEGHFVEKEGTPALIIKGNAEIINADGIIATQKIPTAIEEKDIFNIFFLQSDINHNDAISYLKALATLQPDWLPIRYFMKKAEYNKNQTIELFENIKKGTTKKKTLDSKIKNLKADKPTILNCNNNELKSKIQNKEQLQNLIQKDNEIRKIAEIIMSCNKMELDQNYIIQLLSNLYKDCIQHDKKNHISNIRKAIAYIDRIFFDD